MSEQQTGGRERARDYLVRHGYPLEQALFARHVDGAGSSEAVLEILAGHQNQDGGFCGLEPDWPSPSSSVLSTNRALEVITGLGAGHNNAAVDKAMAWLLGSVQEPALTWRLIPQGIPDHPHAPWWQPDGIEERFGNFELNPTAEVVGYLINYGGTNAEELAGRALDRVIACVRARAELDMHELLCLNRLLNMRVLDEKCQEELTGLLGPLVLKTVATDPADWNGYVLHPLQIVTEPGAVFHSVLADALSPDLDQLASGQEEDGSWPPTFSWEDLHPDAWPDVALAWRSILTLDNVLTLRRFNRF